MTGAGRLSLRPDVAAQVARRLGITPAAPAQPAVPSREAVRTFWAQIAEACLGIAEFDHGARVQPLKIGIREDIEARFPDVPHQVLRRFLKVYCTAGVYFERTVAGATRVDLDGNPAGVVSPEAAEIAAEHLRVLRERRP